MGESVSAAASESLKFGYSQVPRDGARATGLGGAGEKRILIVEDDLALAGFLATELRAKDHFVETIHDGESALHILEGETKYDLVVLDLRLPKVDGRSILRRVKPLQPRLLVLVLSAEGRVEERVKGLQAGADDYLTKPFSIAEFMARVQALLRRNETVTPSRSTVGDLTLDREERRVQRCGRRIDLTPREFSILEFMMRTPGRPISRATLQKQVWNMPPDPSTNIVDVYMKYVRDKVDLPGEPKLTHTIRGVGYEIRAV